MDFKKIVKDAKNIAKDVSNVVKDEYEKRKDDYATQQKIREERERKEEEDREAMRKYLELESEKTSIEMARMKLEQQKMMMNNPVFSRELDQRASEHADPDYVINATFARSDIEAFQHILNQLIVFEPEPIRDENQLQTQLSAFLKGKFPNKVIVREETIETGDRPDIIIDNTFVLEVKVPRDKSALRELLGQLDDYQEIYPNICAVILDDISLNMTETIREYAQKYMDKYKIPTVILKGKRREFKSDSS